MSTEPRIPPQGPDEWTTAARELFAFGEGPEAYEKGSAYTVIRTFAHHPKLMLAWIKFNGRLLRGGRLDPKLREILILRIAWHFRAHYEWVQHIIEGAAHGIGPEHIEAVKIGADAPIWTELERTALRAAEQMLADAEVDDPTWEALAREFDYQQQFEFIFVVGVYTIVAFMFKTLRIAVEPHNAAKAEQIAPGSGADISSHP